MCEILTQVCVGTSDSKMDPQHESEVPPSDRMCAGAVRMGVLQKLSGRGWLFSGSWKKRFCILTHSSLYFYDKEHSSGRDKTCGVLNLEYYDVCEDDPKKPLAFFLDSSVKAFFDNRHQFCAETVSEFEGWTSSIRSAIEETRLARRKRTQEAIPEETPDRLVNANKDRVRGPQGRRPPQRRSLMPASRSEELDMDGRQRSVSLSGPQRSAEGPEMSPVTEGKWLSLSMEDVELDKESARAQRSSSAADIPQQEGAPRKGGPRVGNLMVQHAALTRELEMRLKAGVATRSPCREESTERTEDTTEDQVEAVLHRVKAALQDVEQVKTEYRQALAEMQQAKREYQHLRRECKDLLHRLTPKEEVPQDAE